MQPALMSSECNIRAGLCEIMQTFRSFTLDQAVQHASGITRAMNKMPLPYRYSLSISEPCDRTPSTSPVLGRFHVSDMWCTTCGLRSENDAAAEQRARERQTGLFCEVWTGRSPPSFQDAPAETGNWPITFPSSHGLGSHPNAQPIRQPQLSSSQGQGEAVSKRPDAVPPTGLNISNADPQLQEQLRTQLGRVIC